MDVFLWRSFVYWDNKARDFHFGIFWPRIECAYIKTFKFYHSKGGGEPAKPNITTTERRKRREGEIVLTC